MKCPKCINSNLAIINSYIDNDDYESADVCRYGLCPRCGRTFFWKRTYVLSRPSMINPYAYDDPPKEVIA
jgi:transposase-like protein